MIQSIGANTSYPVRLILDDTAFALGDFSFFGDVSGMFQPLPLPQPRSEDVITYRLFICKPKQSFHPHLPH